MHWVNFLVMHKQAYMCFNAPLMWSTYAQYSTPSQCSGELSSTSTRCTRETNVTHILTPTHSQAHDPSHMQEGRRDCCQLLAKWNSKLSNTGCYLQTLRLPQPRDPYDYHNTWKRVGHASSSVCSLNFNGEEECESTA